MQDLRQLQEKLFFQTRNIFVKLGETQNADELVALQNLLDKATENIAFLKFSAAHPEYFTQPEAPAQETAPLPDEPQQVSLPRVEVTLDQPEPETLLPTHAEIEMQAEADLQPVTFQATASEETNTADIHYETAPAAEKKFRLPSIKALKTTPLPESVADLPVQQPAEHPVPEIRKKPEFRLDLNDKVAFTKSLFKGNEEELRNTIAQLNSFDTMQEAKQYLSDLYHDRNWKKADEYAQRLWSLVENKFM